MVLSESVAYINKCIPAILKVRCLVVGDEKLRGTSIETEDAEYYSYILNQGNHQEPDRKVFYEL